MTNKGRAENFDAILFHSFYSSHLVGDHMVKLKVTHYQMVVLLLLLIVFFVFVWSISTNVTCMWNTWTSFVYCILCERVPTKRSGGRTRCMFLYQKNHRHTTSTGNGKSKSVFYNFCWLQYFEFLIIRKLIVNLTFPYF